MKSLVAYMLMTSMILNISPGKNYKRYIALFTGLLLIALISKPILELFKLKPEALMDYYGMDKALDSSDYLYVHNLYEETNSSIIENELRQSADYLDLAKEEELRNEIKESGATFISQEIIKDEDGRVLRVIAYLRLDKDMQDKKENIRQIIADEYEIEAEKVYIIFR